jgi:uncharacterized protein (DUF2235 family)
VSTPHQSVENIRRQRLAVFFDGTWNTEDDSTNVQHLHTLTQEGETTDGWIQRRFYVRGVGTGLLDQVSGGGFGFGLEGNVREAYNWLVAHYQPDDEIYVFGFSRGAFTARSLVGFIATCGLMTRGAQLTVNQLWEGYTLLGRQRENLQNWWEELVGDRKPPFRRLTDLIDSGGNPLCEPEGLTETLLAECSRRVPIHYLGVFDTVGALGLDALAIPGLRSKMAQHHNPFATTLLQQCRHALAIDEHRASFKLTQFLEDIPNTQTDAPRIFDDNIEQRWFVGAHSNVGGGYPDNLLAARPLTWVLEGAQEAGLKTVDTVTTNLKPDADNRRDSYADFMAPVYTHIVRAKRYFRPVRRPVQINAGVGRRTINEKLDESVVDLVTRDKNYTPANLICHAHHSEDEDLKRAVGDRLPAFQPMGETLKDRLVLILWCTLGAIGFGSFLVTFFPRVESNPAYLACVAVIMLLVDYCEYWGNERAALKPGETSPRVIRDVFQPMRLFIVLMFAIGAIELAIDAWKIGWDTSLKEGLLGLIGSFEHWAIVPISVTAAMLVLSLLARQFKPIAFLTALAGVAIGLYVVMAVIMLASLITEHLVIGVFQSLGDQTQHFAMANLQNPNIIAAGGHLLLMQILILASILTYVGARVPVLGRRGANLGSLLSLQLAITPGRIRKVLARWDEMLTPAWSADGTVQAKKRRVQLLREALARDLLGFVPVFTLLISFVFWLVSRDGSLIDLSGDLVSREIAGYPVWLFLLIITIAANIIADLIHIRISTSSHARLGLLGPLGLIASLIRVSGFIVTVAISVVVYYKLSMLVLAPESGGWRWALANCTSYVIIGYVLTHLTIAVRARFAKRTDSVPDN